MAKQLLVLLLFGFALVLIFYPYIANYLFESRTESVVNVIEQTVQNTDDLEQEAAIEAARNYNRIIASGHIQLKDPFNDEEIQEVTDEYDKLLRMTNEGAMGTIKIPAIDISLPIYHGTSEQVLARGVGHLQGTSLPVGGESSHAVLTGHTGLSNAKLFTDLVKMEKNDIFILCVMGNKFAYAVDQIKVVLPSELNDLSVESGKDYCTLVTCTPYGSNSHRLLVRGIRTDYHEAVENQERFQTKKTESKWMEEYQKALLFSLGCFAVCLLVLLFFKIYSRKRS